MYRKIILSITMIALALPLNGCTVVLQKGRRVDVEKISRLKSELSELERAKKALEDRLSKEIADKEVKVEMLAKGLVKLDKVSGVVQTVVPDLSIGIEGHTDDQPIKYSAWKSNWELSSARALSVLHFLAEKGGVNPARLAAIGYGEYRPIVPNVDKVGRQKNRRVEIVILPPVVKQAADPASN